MATSRQGMAALADAAGGARAGRRLWPALAVAALALALAGVGVAFVQRRGAAVPDAQAALQQDERQAAETPEKGAAPLDVTDKTETSADDAPDAAEEAPAPEPEEPAGPAGWVDDADGVRRYYDPLTHEPAVGWVEDAGKRYYLLEGGVAAPAGWLELDGARYCLAEDGSALVGWQVLDELTYCFDDTGALMHGWADGADGRRRWLKDDGTMATHEWVEIEGVYKVFGDDGALVQGEALLPANDAEHLAHMGARQRAVVESCATAPFQGKGWCGAWVTEVFARAGEPTVTGNACDLYDAWCTSGNIDDLRPGMLVAVPSHPQSENGKIWGHVCIYVGDGMVWDNGSYSTRIMALGDWACWFGASHEVRWGWANGINLEEV